MKRPYLLIAILALILPILVRGIWFYRGIPAERPQIATPDYASFARSQVSVNTPDVENLDQPGGTVLLDGYHGNQFTLNEIESFTSAIRRRGGNMETITDSISLETKLKSANAFVTISPTSMFSEYEDLLLKSFADRGGKILVFTDATRNSLYFDYFSGNPIAYGDSVSANSLLKLFDISIANDYLYNTEKNEGNFRNVFFDKFGKNELTFGLSDVAFYGARSVQTTSGLLLLQGAETNLSSLDDAHDPDSGGAALSEDGNVAAFGDFTFLSTPYSTYNDNAVLIQNMADFALAGKQTPNLNLFPYVFTQETIQVYLPSDLERTSSMVSALGSLQSSLRLLNLTLEFVDDMPSSGDVIIISSFDATDDLDDYLKKADVEIEDDLINTVEFGEVNRSGNGLIFFNEGKKGNTLVLLADNPDDIISLMGVIGYGTLNPCLTSDKVAVCSVGFGESRFSDSAGDTFEEIPADTGDGTTEPVIEATPTPGG